MKLNPIVSNFLLLLFIATAYSFTTSKKNIVVDLRVSITNEKLLLSVSSKKETLHHYTLKIFNLKGKEVKLVNLPESNQTMEAVISIEDIDIGEYTYSLLKSNKKVFKGRFVKDWYDFL